MSPDEEKELLEWGRAHRARCDLSLILIDVDYFKLYNDRYGHLAGDESLKMLAKPQGPLIAYGSVDPSVNIFSVGDRMQERGWTINRLQFPDGLHGMVTARHLEVVDAYLADLQASVDTARAHPELAQSGAAAVYGMIAHAPLRDMVRSQVLDTFAGYYVAQSQPSGKTGPL